MCPVGSGGVGRDGGILKNMRTALLSLLVLAAPAGATISSLEEAFANAQTQAAPKGGFNQSQIDALRRLVPALQQCWYVKLDEKCFWSHVSAASALTTDPEFHAMAYAGAFDGTPDPKTLVMDINRISMGGPKKPAFLNDPVVDGYFLLDADEFFDKINHMDPAELAEYRKAGVMPTGDFLAVMYHVAGEGYTEEGMTLLFTLENGTWKLFALFGWD